MPGMSVSPNVGDQGDVPSPEQAEEMFKQKFSDTAYSVLFAKFSDLAPSVVTFKVLETDAETGNGVGAFILLHDNKPVYIPVVMVDSRLKPIEMFYYKDLNVFLPLQKEWLDEVTKASLDSMGEPADVPTNVPQDVNIRDLVMPPYTQSGRVGLAFDFEDGVNHMFNEAGRQNLDIHPRFLDTIEQAPKVALDGIKLAFEKHPGLLQKVAAVYGVTNLKDAFQRGYARAESEKVASAPEGELTVLCKGAAAERIVDVFGSNAEVAFNDMLTHGFAVSDTRTTVKHAAVKIEQKVELQAAGPAPGWFTLYFLDGQSDDFLVVPKPVGSDSCCEVAGNYGGGGEYYNTGTDDKDSPFDGKKAPALVISKDLKRAFIAPMVVGMPIAVESQINTSKLWSLMTTGKRTAPRPETYGFFLVANERGLQVTAPTIIKTVTKSKGTVTVKTGYSTLYIIDNDPSRKRIDVISSTGVTMLPKEATWVTLNTKGSVGKDDFHEYRLKNEHKKDLILDDPKLISRWMNEKLQTAGGKQVTVKKAGVDSWWVAEGTAQLDRPHALAKVADVYDVTVEDANGILKDAQENIVSTAYVFDAPAAYRVLNAMQKTAQPGMGGTAPAPGMQQQGMEGMQANMAAAPGDPSAQGGDPSMWGMQPQPAPSPMSPTDLAIAEVVDGLQQQNQMQQQQQEQQMMQQQEAMQMQQQNNQQLVQVLQQIQQRSAEIGNATGGLIPAGAEESPAAAAQMLAPTPEPEPEPPAQPMMTSADASPEMIAEQINPELVDQAAELQDGKVFDTAAIGMLASAPILQDIVSLYIPNLEKAIDNIGRIILTLWMKESDTKSTIGDDAYISLEDKLRTVFKNLGDVVLEVNRNALNAQPDADQVKMTTEQ